MTAYFSSDGTNWNQFGQGIDVLDMDDNQPNYSFFTGSRQGDYM
jgi:hypothetical protein